MRLKKVPSKKKQQNAVRADINWVHFKLSKYISNILEAYFRCEWTDGSDFSVSLVLCSLKKACFSKPSKHTFKSRSTRLTSLLTLYKNKIRKLKHQSNCNKISRLHLAGNWGHAHINRLLPLGLRFKNKEKSTENSNLYQRRP